MFCPEPVLAKRHHISFVSEHLALKKARRFLLPQGASTEASSEFLADYAPQYVAGEFPKYLKRSQPFKNVPRL
jgi:acyl-homoserine lactone acylase PvdQ